MSNNFKFHLHFIVSFATHDIAKLPEVGFWIAVEPGKAGWLGAGGEGPMNHIDNYLILAIYTESIIHCNLCLWWRWISVAAFKENSSLVWLRMCIHVLLLN